MVDKTIGALDPIVRPLATDVYETESLTEGSVRIDFDTLRCGPMLPAVTQALGFTAANIVEVEAATKAMRVTVRPTDLGGGQDQMFTVTRHAVGAQASLTLTTASYADYGFFAGWWDFSGLAFLNKCSISMCTSAVSGTRVGNCVMRLSKVSPMLSPGPSSTLIIPPLTAAANAPSGDFSSLDIRQVTPQLFLTVAQASTSLVTAGIEQQTKSLSVAVGNCRAVVGEQNIKPHALFDAWDNGSYQPYTMSIGHGFVVTADGPAASTSQTINVSANFQWDEWIPVAPDRI